MIKIFSVVIGAVVTVIFLDSIIYSGTTYITGQQDYNHIGYTIIMTYVNYKFFTIILDYFFDRLAKKSK